MNKEIGNVIESAEDYSSYLGILTESTEEVYEKLKNNYEEEYNKVESVFNTVTKLLTDYKNKVQSCLQDTMIKQQLKLVEQSKTINTKQEKISEINQKLKEIHEETGNPFQSIKKPILDLLCGNEDQISNENSINDLKHQFFILTQIFEEELKFKPISSIELSSLYVNLESALHILDTFKLLDNKLLPINQKKELNPDVWKFNEKMQNIKRPVLLWFSRSQDSNLCTILKYDLISHTLHKTVKTMKELNHCVNFMSLDLSNCECIRHPNCTSTYLIGPTFNLLYDNVNEIFLKKPFFPPLNNTKKFVTTILHNHIYFIGGIRDYKVLSVAARYNILTEKWSFIGNLNIQRFNAGACPIDDYEISVIGGENFNSFFLDTIELCTVQNSSWRLSQIRLTEGLKSFSVVSTHKDRIFLFGGEGRDGLFNSAQELDFLKKFFIPLENSFYPRKKAKAFNVNGVIYVFGGFSKNGTASLGEKFSLSENKWVNLEKDHTFEDYYPYINCPASLLYE